MAGNRGPTLYLAVSRHGYGHATRLGSIAAEVQRLLPEVRIVAGGRAPRELLSGYIPGPFEQRRVELDAGVVQPDSLTIDAAATLRAALRIQRSEKTIVSREMAFLRRAGVRLILADIPPLAARLAEAAGVPCWMVSNFGWDYIYAAWGEVERGPCEKRRDGSLPGECADDLAALVAWIQDSYRRCDRLFRLPFHEPMSAFPTVTDAGLTGGRPRWPAEVLRTRLGIDRARDRVALVTFGGFGRHRIPYEALSRRQDWLFLVFDPHAPDGPNVLPLRDTHLRPVDLMPLCDRLIAKPGFSTFSEAVREGVPIVTVPRPGFAEAEVLVAGMTAVHPHQVIDLDSFLAGEWSFLDQVPDPPLTGETVDKRGTETIAREVVEALAGR